MASSIGIKIANGEFYPIVEENSLIKKRLILTTVHDNQPSVQIDLYRSPVNAMTDAQYIGTVVVENIKPRPKGEPSIEMVISSDENGNVIADAIDLDTGAGGEHYVLTVSLKSMDDISRDADIPDFELESNEEPPSSLYHHSNKIRKEKKSSKAWIFVLIGLILILGLLAAWLFFLGGLNVVRPWFDRPASEQTYVAQQDNPNQSVSAAEQQGSQTVNPGVTPSPPVSQTEQAAATEPVRQTEPVQQTTEPVRQTEPVQQTAEPVRQVEPVQQTAEPVRQAEPVRPVEPVQQAAAPVPVIQAPAAPPAPRAQPVTRRNPPVASYNVPATIPREGVNYVIRWGDTLWDISAAFYRDPWLYPRIARFNNINNPNLIISGRTIRIPPRN